MSLEWSPFLLPKVFFLTDPRPLGASSNEIELMRGPNLALSTRIKTDGPVGTEAVLPGSEFRGLEIPVATRSFRPGILHGYRARDWTSRTTPDGPEPSIVFGSADSLEIEINDGESVSISEWISNAPECHWVRSTNRSQIRTTAKKRGRTTVQAEEKEESFRRDHSEFLLNLPTLGLIRVGTVEETSVTEGIKIVQPGFVEFFRGANGLPDAEIRHSARRALEFLFGRGFGVLGHSALDEEGQTVKAALSSAFVPGGVGPSLPPGLLHSQMIDGHDEVLVADFVKKYLELQATYDLNRAIWLYLHGRSAPMDMAAGYVGAAFEILRRGYYEQPENEARSKLLPRPLWKELSAEITSAISNMANSSGWSEHSESVAGLKKGLGNLNAVSGTQLNLRFLDDLGLKHGATEKAALAARNDSAHANRLTSGDAFTTLREYRGLHTLFARALFAVLRVNVSYFDYSTLRFPPRPLAQAQGGASGQ